MQVICIEVHAWGAHRNRQFLHESKFIYKIIKVIEDKLSRTPLHVAPFLIGIYSRVKEINKWLQDGSTDVELRAICGMGGIGKTTIAKYVYNQNFGSFGGSSFLANINEMLEQPNGLVCLQTQLLFDISGREQRKVHNVDEGLAKIINVVHKKKVLLILDDVEQDDQIYAILGMRDWLFPGSKVIITTRHERLLKPHEIFRVDELDKGESIQLFSLHAFGENFPLESYTEHTERVVQICKGLPLALKVIGSSLSGKSEGEWVNQLGKLEAIPHNQILKKLKISYDTLQDDHDRRLFLHVACFFNGTNKDYAIILLEKCDLHAKIGIQNLIDRCLLERDGHKVLRMHRLIRDMGREIVRQESHEVGGRSRLWHHGDSFRVLQNETGTNTVEGLILDMRMVEEVGNTAKKRRYEEFHGKSILLKHASSLKRRLLGFVSGQSVSTTLTSLHEFLESLKILDLSFSEWLVRTPNFLGLPNLERLILKGCMSLVEVCESIEYAEMLDLLDLQDCKTLRKLPRNIDKLVSLRILVISGCNIVEFPSEMNKMKSLEVIKANGIDLNLLQTSSGEVKLLQQIFRSRVPTPRKGPEIFWACLPYSLKSLSMSGSNLSDDSFPENFGNLPSLSDLDLSKNQFQRLPNCIRSLRGLKSLDMYQCHRLQSLDLNGLMMKSGCIDVTSCRSLEKVMSLNERVDLWLNGCYKMVGQEDTWKDFFKKEDKGKEYMQGTFEYGKFNIYLEARDGPIFPAKMHQSTQSFVSAGYLVPPLPTDHRTQCLNVWCSMSSEKTEIVRGISLHIENKRNDENWISIPNDFPKNENVGWLSRWRWRFAKQLEAGHESSVTFDIKDEYVVKDGFKIVYRDAEAANGSASTLEDDHHNSTTNWYFVQRHFRKNPNEDFWFPRRLNRTIFVQHNCYTNMVESLGGSGCKTDKLMLKCMPFVRWEEVGNNAKKRRYEKFHDKSILLKHASSLKRQQQSEGCNFLRCRAKPYCRAFKWIDDHEKMKEASETVSSQEEGGTFEYGKFNIYLEATADPMFPAEEFQNPSIASAGYNASDLPTHHRTQCLNVWCSTSEKAGIIRWVPNGLQNKKTFTEIRSPNYFPNSENVGWLSRWRFRNQSEAGDESAVTFDIKDEYEVNESGFKIVYGHAKEANGSASTKKESHHNYPIKYSVHRYFEKNPNEDLWFPKRLKRVKRDPKSNKLKQQRMKESSVGLKLHGTMGLQVVPFIFSNYPESSTFLRIISILCARTDGSSWCPGPDLSAGGHNNWYQRSMVDPRICETIPIAGLGEVSKKSVDLKAISRYEKREQLGCFQGGCVGFSSKVK
ncbi:hypothetical protein LguiA_008373 [Lonicera macranthoides]